MVVVAELALWTIARFVPLEAAGTIGAAIPEGYLPVGIETVQLYEDYLSNFIVNVEGGAR